jgi:excisionase family DNA binding protein
MSENRINIEPEYYDLKGLSRSASIPVPTARDYIKKEGLPCFKVRGKVLIKRTEFEAWLENYRLKSNVDEIVSDVLNSLESDIQAGGHSS